MHSTVPRGLIIQRTESRAEVGSAVERGRLSCADWPARVHSFAEDIETSHGSMQRTASNASPVGTQTRTPRTVGGHSNLTSCSSATRSAGTSSGSRTKRRKTRRVCLNRTLSPRKSPRTCAQRSNSSRPSRPISRRRTEPSDKSCRHTDRAAPSRCSSAASTRAWPFSRHAALPKTDQRGAPVAVR